MAVEYKVIKLAQPGVKWEGITCIIHVCNWEKIDLNFLSESISNKCTLAKADIYATLAAFTEEIPQLLMDNYTISLGELGILTLHDRSTSTQKGEEVTRKNLTKAK